MKELNNDDFFVRWQPVHDKGFMAYMLKEQLGTTAGVIIFAILTMVLKPSIDRETIHILVLSYLIMYAINIFVGISKWKGSEKRYRYMEEVYSEIKQSRDAAR